MTKQKTISVGWATKYEMNCPAIYEVVDNRTGDIIQITKSLHDKINKANMGSTVRGKTSDGQMIECVIGTRFY